MSASASASKKPQVEAWVCGFILAAYQKGVNPLKVLRTIFPGNWEYKKGGVYFNQQWVVEVE